MILSILLMKKTRHLLYHVHSRKSMNNSPLTLSPSRHGNSTSNASILTSTQSQSTLSDHDTEDSGEDSSEDSDCDNIPTYFPNTKPSSSAKPVQTRIWVNSLIKSTTNQSKKDDKRAKPNRNQQEAFVGTGPNTTMKAITSHQKKTKQKGAIVGTGPSTTLKAATRKPNSHHGNRTCTGLFVSSLEPQCTTKQVNTYIWKHAGVRVRSEKIPIRYMSHSSFYLPCDNTVRESLKDPSIWPADVFVKPYYS